MDYLFIGYKNKVVIDLLLDTIGENNNIYIYSDDPIYETQSKVKFVKNDTFKDKAPDVVYLDIPEYYLDSWYDVVSQWGCQEIALIGEK